MIPLIAAYRAGTPPAKEPEPQYPERILHIKHAM